MRLWENDAGKFTEISSATGIADNGQGRGLIKFDYDNDGDLDIYVVRNSDWHLLFRNDSSSEHDWVKIKLAGSVSNAGGIGAKVIVRYGKKDDAREQVAIVSASDNFLGANEVSVHFGFGDILGGVRRSIIFAVQSF